MASLNALYHSTGVLKDKGKLKRNTKSTLIKPSEWLQLYIHQPEYKCHTKIPSQRALGSGDKNGSKHPRKVTPDNAIKSSPFQQRLTVWILFRISLWTDRKGSFPKALTQYILVKYH